MQLRVLLFGLAGLLCVLGSRPSDGNGLSALLASNGGLVGILDRSHRIVGGMPTTIERFPWTVSMLRFGEHRCGASIISPNRILTAAHCTVRIEASTLQIRAGSVDNTLGGQLLGIVRIINHGAFNADTLDNDIAVLWLGSALNMGPVGVAAIPMPAFGAGVATGALAQVAGWGALCQFCAGTHHLRFVSVPIVASGQCNAWYGGGITAGMLCAGFPEGGRDACQGDSGGPLTLGGLLVGVVSWGHGCARPNTPGVYARVSFYRNWIQSNM